MFGFYFFFLYDTDVNYVAFTVRVSPDRAARWKERTKP